MRVPGYCECCHKVRHVRVSTASLACAVATNGVFVGTCSDCERKEDEERTTRFRRRHNTRIGGNHG